MTQEELKQKVFAVLSYGETIDAKSAVFKVSIKRNEKKPKNIIVDIDNSYSFKEGEELEEFSEYQLSHIYKYSSNKDFDEQADLEGKELRRKVNDFINSSFKLKLSFWLISIGNLLKFSSR